MSGREYFEKALSDFTIDVASGGAIRHLADRGYTVAQIMKKLDFPTPYDRVQQTVWKYLLEKGQIVLAEPAGANPQPRYAYVVDYDAYGRSSFRRVTVKEQDTGEISWRETCFERGQAGDFWACLAEKCAENGEASAYVSCDFGLRMKRDPEGFAEMLRTLAEEQSEYIQGLPWERRMAWHRLDERMRKIMARLREKAGYHGICYFVRLGEKVHF